MKIVGSARAQVTTKTNDVAGDGTTATICAQQWAREGLKKRSSRRKPDDGKIRH